MIPSISVSRFSTLQPYQPLYEQMKEYTRLRGQDSPDAIWLLEHHGVFTQGLAGKKEHILDAGDIPVIQSDRGGQVTYHGPGQLMIYTLIDLKRLNMGVKQFVRHLENTVIELLQRYDILGHTQCGAPGVYVNDAKICSLGLRVSRGCAYHGLSLNVNMDLSPFKRINPCGFHLLRMTQISDFIPNISVQTVMEEVLPILLAHLSPTAIGV
ncbi:MAG: octanoyltransferase [Gammaproteobacteria bacterium 39-13]|nr:lipoyl(octanoyl) transferase LipB [Gammaproteobacteria bacterium]OJV96014.1 MAG: octanoyltransferase [Gammaproteobacteria bacterium 39-13]